MSHDVYEEIVTNHIFTDAWNRTPIQKKHFSRILEIPSAVENHTVSGWKAGYQMGMSGYWNFFLGFLTMKSWNSNGKMRHLSH